MRKSRNVLTSSAIAMLMIFSMQAKAADSNAPRYGYASRATAMGDDGLNKHTEMKASQSGRMASYAPTQTAEQGSRLWSTGSGSELKAYAARVSAYKAIDIWQLMLVIVGLVVLQLRRKHKALPGHALISMS